MQQGTEDLFAPSDHYRQEGEVPLRPFRSQGLAVDKLEDQLLEDQNILNFLHKFLGSFITVQGLNIQKKRKSGPQLQ